MIFFYTISFCLLYVFQRSHFFLCISAMPDHSPPLLLIFNAAISLITQHRLMCAMNNISIFTKHFKDIAFGFNEKRSLPLMGRSGHGWERDILKNPFEVLHYFQSYLCWNKMKRKKKREFAGLQDFMPAFWVQYCSVGRVTKPAFPPYLCESLNERGISCAANRNSILNTPSILGHFMFWCLLKYLKWTYSWSSCIDIL